MTPLNPVERIEFSDERPRTVLLFDSLNFRMAMFCLEVGQEVPSHTSASEVIMHVYQGSGRVTSGTEVHMVKAGEVVVCKPNEPHGFSADKERLVVLAVITPPPA